MESPPVSHDDPEFGTYATPLKALAGEAFPIKAVIRVLVEDVEPLLAPSLWMYPNVEPAERRAGVLAAYGVTDA